ncbi:RNA-directed DNA polymerase, eukaryota, nucleotide-binding alpha-beta plait domain protein [Tanacetum coccineum]
MDSIVSKEKFGNNTGVGSWFSVVKLACTSFVCEDQIVWISIEGLPLKGWSRNTFVKVASKWGELVDWEDFTGSSFAFKRICVKTKVDEIICERFKVIVQGKVYWIRAKEMEVWSPFLRENTTNSSSDEDSDKEVEGSAHGTNDVDRVSESSCMHANGFVYENGNTKKVSEDEPFRSEDPFGIYDILNRNKDSRELSKEDDLSHPPGFTPRMDNGEEEHITDKGVNVEETNERVTSMPSNTNVGEQVTDEGVNTEENNKRAKSTSSNFNQPLSNDDVSLFGSNCLHKLKTGGYFLEVMDEIVKVVLAEGWVLSSLKSCCTVLWVPGKVGWLHGDEYLRVEGWSCLIAVVYETIVGLMGGSGLFSCWGGVLGGFIGSRLYTFWGRGVAQWCRRSGGDVWGWGGGVRCTREVGFGCGRAGELGMLWDSGGLGLWKVRVSGIFGACVRGGWLSCAQRVAGGGVGGSNNMLGFIGFALIVLGFRNGGGARGALPVSAFVLIKTALFVTSSCLLCVEIYIDYGQSTFVCFTTGSVVNGFDKLVEDTGLDMLISNDAECYKYYSLDIITSIGSYSWPVSGGQSLAFVMGRRFLEEGAWVMGDGVRPLVSDREFGRANWVWVFIPTGTGGGGVRRGKVSGLVQGQEFALDGKPVYVGGCGVPYAFRGWAAQGQFDAGVDIGGTGWERWHWLIVGYVGLVGAGTCWRMGGIAKGGLTSENWRVSGLCLGLLSSGRGGFEYWSQSLGVGGGGWTHLVGKAGGGPERRRGAGEWWGWVGGKHGRGEGGWGEDKMNVKELNCKRYSYVQSLLDGLTVVNWLNLGLEKLHSKLHTKRWYITISFRRDIVIHMPEDLQDVLPPVMEKHQSGLPKNKDRIQSQGERKNNICHVLVLGQPNANGRKGEKLVHAPVNSLYYYKVGKTLKQGLCSLKNDADVQGFLKVGYESKWVVDLYVELYGALLGHELLVFCGRDVSKGRCAGYHSKKVKANKQLFTESNDDAKKGEGTSKDGEGSSRNSDVSPKWTKSKIASSRKSSQPQCGFRLWASWMGSENSFQIKSLKAEHKCAINYNLGSLVTYKWIAQHFAKEIIEDPFIPLLKIKAAIREKFLINVSLGQCKRAKRSALYIFEGGLIEHYGRLWEYRQAILDTNPGSTCIVDEEETEYGNTYFRRFYICFKGVKDGWKAGCRRVIGLDGCFLKHTCKGELLTAIWRDANNQMYLIAWAVVKLPNAEHRKCIRHVFANFKKKFSGVQLQRLFWLAVGTIVESIFYLVQRNPNSWSKAFFDLNSKCASFENGIAESFNRAILAQRTKPIITMLEDIRLYIMQRLVQMKTITIKLEDRITPSIRKRIEVMKEQQRFCTVVPSGFQELEVRKGEESFRVNLHLKKCMCKLWELSGIPCVHSVAAYLFLNKEPDERVDHCYSQERWVEA